MKIRFVAPILTVALLAACGGASPGATTKPGVTAKPAGQVDCEALRTAAAQLLTVQFLAQLKTPDAVKSIKDKAIGNVDLDAFLAAMHTLHALDTHPSVLGDPKAAIDFYEKAGKAAIVLFATEPLTQAAIDTYYNENVGSVAEFIGHQAAISGAMGEAGC